MQRAELRQLDALTSLRFFLALGVLGGHFMGHFPGKFTHWPAFFFDMAPIAVSWFFILSGFVIAYNYPKLPTRRDRVSFLVLRFARIWPVHLVTLVAFFLLFGHGTPLRLLSNLTLTQTWTAEPFFAGSYNGVSWSVSNELFFYCIYAALMLPIGWLRVPLVVIPIGFAWTLAWRHGCFVTGSDFDWYCGAYIQKFPPAHLIEFLAGMALFHLKLRIPQALGLVVAFTVMSNFVPTLPNYHNHLLLTELWFQLQVIIGGGALIAALARDGWLSRLLSNRPLIFGGEISYSIYMVHLILIDLILPRNANFSLPVQFVLICGVVIGTSVILFNAVENPIRNGVKKWLKSRETFARPSSDEGLAPDNHDHLVSAVQKTPYNVGQDRC